MRRLSALCCLALAWLLPAAAGTFGDYPIHGVPFSQVRLSDGFWLPRISQNQSTTIPIALRQCYDTRRVLNFQKAAAILQGRNIGWFDTDYTFDDTDIYKILEGMSYSWQTSPSPAIKASMDSLVAIVAAAQEPDGYLYTARTAGQPGHYHDWVGPERWEWDPIDSHELYNSGHLFEAAAAHYTATGDTTLLAVAERNADLLADKFLRGGLAYEPGHQIVEMGLVKLYRATGRDDYLRLAKYFLDIRGTGGPNSQADEYHQSHIPPKDQRQAVGHAVRATYMYSGMADVAALMGEDGYREAVDALWHDVASGKLYITGGIGARHSGEAFGQPYELPNGSAYNETCAAIANVYWNWRMFLATGEAKYYDILERTLYNGVLAGISLSGDRFFYPNPLESAGGYTRSEWFGCACCPSNLCRFIPSVPGYIYAADDYGAYVNLFVEGRADIPISGDTLRLSQATGYPWRGEVAITIDGVPQSRPDFALRIRRPGWTAAEPVPGDLYQYTDEAPADIAITVNGQPADYIMDKGYMVIARQWQAGDKVSFRLPMSPRRVITSRIAEDRGRIALERGPIVYCIEQDDNGTGLADIVVPDDARITTIASTELTAATEQSATLLRINGKQAYTDADTIALRGKTVVAIPYYAWDNRTAGAMRVWIARNAKGTAAGAAIVESADTLDISIVQSATCGAYEARPAFIDRVAAARALHTTTDGLAQLYGQTITYAAITPAGTTDTNSTANAPGHWFAADGSIATWGNASVLYSEYQPQDRLFRVGYYPGLAAQGDSYTIMQALTIADGDTTRRIVLRTRLAIGTDADVLAQAKATARHYYDSPDYANIGGDARTALRLAIEGQSASALDQATLAFLDCQTADAIAAPKADKPAANTARYNIAGQQIFGKGSGIVVRKGKAYINP